MINNFISNKSEQTKRLITMILVRMFKNNSSYTSNDNNLPHNISMDNSDQLSEPIQKVKRNEKMNQQDK